MEYPLFSLRVSSLHLPQALQSGSLLRNPAFLNYWKEQALTLPDIHRSARRFSHSLCPSAPAYESVLLIRNPLLVLAYLVKHPLPLHSLPEYQIRLPSMLDSQASIVKCGLQIPAILSAQMSGTRVGRLHEFAFFACAFVFSVVFFASVHIHPLLFSPFFDCYMPKSYRLYYYYCNKNDSILFSYSITISL